MSQSNKISVIIPAYNVENEISRSLDSVLQQTYQNIEIVIVNDGSADRTGEIADQYAKKYHQIQVIHQKNQGVFRARMNGIQCATGDWIGFLDADDEMEPQMYEVLLQNAQKYDADISHCGYQMVFPSRVDYYHDTGRLRVQDNKTGLQDLIEGQIIEPCLCNKLFSRRLFQKVIDDDLLDTSIKINEDLLLNYYLFKQARTSIFYDRCFYHYVLRINSTTTSKINVYKLEDPYKVLNIILNDTEDKEIRNSVLQRMARLLVSQATMPTKDNPVLIKKYRKKARRELYLRNQELMTAVSNHKLRLMIQMGRYCPWLYAVIHAAYAHIKGYDKIYDVK